MSKGYPEVLEHIRDECEYLSRIPAQVDLDRFLQDDNLKMSGM